MKVYFLLAFTVGLVVFGISEAQQEREPTPMPMGNGKYLIEGKNYDKVLTPQGHTTQVVWTSHYERLYDYDDENGNPVYVDFKTENRDNYYNFHSAGISTSFSKSGCALNVHEPGKIGNNEAPEMVLSHTVKEALNSTDDWYDMPVNDEPCSFSVIENDFGVSIVSTKSDGSGTFEVIYDIAPNAFEWTYKYTLENSEKHNDYKHGFSFVCDGTDCHNTRVDDIPLDEGDELSKDQFIEKPIDVSGHQLDLKNEQHDRIWVLKKTQENKIIVDFTHAKGATALDQTITVDPTFTSDATTLTEDGHIKDNDDSDTCNSGGSLSRVSGIATIVVRIFSGGSSDDCHRGYFEYDVSSITDGSTIDNSVFKFDISTVSTPEECDYVALDTQPSTATDSALMTAIGSDTVVVDADTTCKTTGNNKEVDLSPTFDTYVEGKLTGDWVAIGVKSDDETIDGTDHQMQFASEEDGSATPIPTLEITYTENLEWSPGPPISNTVTRHNSTMFNFTFTTDNATGVEGYTIWRNSSTVDFDDIALTGNFSDTGFYEDNTRSFGDQNCYKASAFSANNGTNSTALCNAISAPTEASISLATGNVGDTEQVNATITITNGTTDFDLTQTRLFVNGTGDDTNSTQQTLSNNTVVNVGPFWFRMTTDDLYNFTLRMNVQNHTGFRQYDTITIESGGTTDIRDYDPVYQSALTSGLGQVNSTTQRTADQDEVTVKVNRISVPSGETWTLNCLLQNQQEAVFTNNTGTWVNRSGVGYYNASLSGFSTSHLYGQCFNPDDPVLTFVSYTNSSLALLGIQSFDQSYGEFLGVPVGVFFILMAAGAASPRTAPTWIVVILGMIGVMTTIGFFTLDANVWALALILGLLGLMVGRKFI